MAVETLKKINASIVLENGTDTKGNLKTVSMTLGTLEASEWDADKAIAIIAALEPILGKTLYTSEVDKLYTFASA